MSPRVTVDESPGRASEPPAALGDDTVSRLVEAAARVFAEKGYDGAGVAEIARRAGLTTGAIYSRFRGKADLLVAAIGAHAPDEIGELFAEHRPPAGPLDVLRTVGSHLVTQASADRGGLLLEGFVAARRDPDVAAVLRAAFDCRRARLAALVEQGKAEGLLDPAVDTSVMVHFAHAVGLGFLAYDALGVGHPDAEEWDALLVRLVAALAPPPSSSTTTAASAAPAPPPSHPS